MTRYFRHTEWLAVREQIAVAVCTYKRPVMLRACLASLQDAGAAVLVINNDPHTPDLGELPGNPTVVHEKARGIANARNRALREAQARGYRYLAFIDDDETDGADCLFN